MVKERYDKVTISNPDINGGTAVIIPCTVVSLGGTKNIVAKPEANGTQSAEVQTQSFENMSIAIQGVHYVNESGYIDWDYVRSLYTLKYDTTNYSTLNVTYGKSTGTDLIGVEGSTDIKVILKSFNLPLDQSVSDRAYRPVGTLTFIETR